VLSLTGPQDTLKAAQEHLEGFGAPVPIPPSAMPTFAPQASRTALLAPAQGAYVAWCLPAVRFPNPDAPLLDVAAHLLSLGETWEAVRAQGGAYGASCEYDSLLGSLSFLSYRDPDPEHSLRVFRELSATGHAFAWTRQQIASALPAVANNDQRPLRPLRVTRMVLHHHLNGISYAARDAYRARLLEATPETVLAALSRALGERASVASFCALGASDLLAPLPAEFNCSAIPLLG
jgi:Zn-dependent M16 (insulinase) family peptidase